MITMNTSVMEQPAITNAPRKTRTHQLTPLDLGSPEEIEQFEKAFYEGFKKSTHNKLIHWLWEWDEQNQRIRARVPYEDQMIWVGKTGNTVIGGIAVNTRLALLQSGAFGFTIPENLRKNSGICEILVAFSFDDHSLVNLHADWIEVFRALQASGYTDALATCAKKLLPLYMRMGARIIDELIMEGEARYFLQFELVRTARWTARLDESAKATNIVSKNPQEALSEAAHEITILLARLLPMMDIARGIYDRNFGIETRKMGALHVISTARSRLAQAAQEPELASKTALKSTQMNHLETLWRETCLFVETVAQHQDSIDMDIMIESLEALLFTAIEVFDDENSANVETFAELMNADRETVFERLLARAQTEKNKPCQLATALEHFKFSLAALRELSNTFSKP